MNGSKILTASQALNLMLQKGYIIKDGITLNHELGVAVIFSFLKPLKDGLFAVPFIFFLTTTSLLQTFTPIINF